MSGITAGAVRRFNEPGGFGFIARDDSRPDCFVTRFDFRRGDVTTLAAGERVESPELRSSCAVQRWGVSAGDTLAVAHSQDGYDEDRAMEQSRSEKATLSVRPSGTIGGPPSWEPVATVRSSRPRST